MIKEDHLLACTTKMFEILVALTDPSQISLVDEPANVLDRPDHSGTPELPNTHPRGLSDYSLVKELNRLLPTFVSPVVIPESFVRRLLSGVPDWGGESYRSFCDCQPVSQTFIFSRRFVLTACWERLYRPVPAIP